MLAALVIKGFQLIPYLEIRLNSGLTVLTGETGEGKSIILDALSLVLGKRADIGPIATDGTKPGSAEITALFIVDSKHPALSLLDIHGFPPSHKENSSIQTKRKLLLSWRMRKVEGTSRRARIFVNDRLVSIAFIRQLGSLLVEIQGQFEAHGLLDEQTHAGRLDTFAGHSELLQASALAFEDWQVALRMCDQVDHSRQDSEFLRAAVAEIDALGPQDDEEQKLIQERRYLMQSQDVVEAVASAYTTLVDVDQGVETNLSRLRARLDRVAIKAQDMFDETLRALSAAEVELREAIESLSALREKLESDPDRLEANEQRLFALRAAARKYGVAIADLSSWAEKIAKELRKQDQIEEMRQEAIQAAGNKREAFILIAEKLSLARRRSGRLLAEKVRAECEFLRLKGADFVVHLTRLPESRWSALGWDQVVFEATTTPGLDLRPLARIASGGELSRFALALQVVGSKSSASCLVFDEIDTGVGGATASAIGERLHRLSEGRQILVVTHSPQVAALADYHMLVTKHIDVGIKINFLSRDERREEIARMLSGVHITEAARSAADSLLKLSAGKQ